VVKASPDNPPYSLICLAERLIDRNVGVLAQCHCHSTVVDHLDGLQDFLPTNEENQAEAAVKLSLRIIWKESED